MTTKTNRSAKASPTVTLAGAVCQSLPAKHLNWITILCSFGLLALGPAPASHAQNSTQVSPDRYSQAESLVRGHQWDAGLTLLLPMLKSDPHNLKAINLTALAYTGKGQISQADEYFEQALKIDSSFLPALKNLGINEVGEGKSAEAERHLSSALRQAPDDPVINLYLGELAFQRNDFSRVVATLPRAQPFFARDGNLAAHLAIAYLAIDEPQKAQGLLEEAAPSRLDPSTQLALGVNLAGKALYDDAVPYLTAVRDNHPDSYSAAYDLALCYLNLKQYPGVITTLRRTISQGHETAEIDNMLAEAYEGSRETQNAIDALRRAIALAPDDVSGYLEFASICIDHQDYPAALKVIEAGIQASPASDQLFFERGILYAVQDNFKLAEADFKKASELSPGKDANYKGLGILYLESGNAEEAVATLKRRLQSKPDDPDLLYLLGEALLRSGAQPGDEAYRAAQAAFEKSIKLDPTTCLPRVSLGKMYLEEGRVEDAVSQLEKARAADPKEKSTYWQLAMAYRKQGRAEEQKEVLLSLKKLNDGERIGSRGNAEAAAPSPQASETKSN